MWRCGRGGKIEVERAGKERESDGREGDGDRRGVTVREEGGNEAEVSVEGRGRERRRARGRSEGEEVEKEGKEQVASVLVTRRHPLFDRRFPIPPCVLEQAGWLAQNLPSRSRPSPSSPLPPEPHLGTAPAIRREKDVRRRGRRPPPGPSRAWRKSRSRRRKEHPRSCKGARESVSSGTRRGLRVRENGCVVV